MARDIPDLTGEALLRPQLAAVALVKLVFDSGVFTMFLGGWGEIEWGGYTWYGAGKLGRIGAIEETVETRAAGVELELSGIGADVLEVALGEDWQGRDGRIYYGVLNDANQWIGAPFQVRRGLMDVMTLTKGSEYKIALQLEPYDIDFGRNKARRYTAEDQRAEHPGDKGADQVALLQEKVVNWAG